MHKWDQKDNRELFIYLKNEYKKAFLEQLKKMLEEKQIKKETDANVKVKKY